MRATTLVLCCGLLATATSQLAAHGIPIMITADAGLKLYTDKQTYNSGAFELLGGVLLLTDQPGYSVADNKQGIANGTTVQINVVDQLLWWQNGVVRLDSNETLEIDNGLGGFTEIDRDTVFVPNFTIDTYSGSSGWHVHVDYILQSTAAPAGAYGLLLQITAPGYQKSDNFLVVLNNGLAGSTFNTAASDMAKAEFQKPGDANGDGYVDGADYTQWANHFLQAATWRNGNYNFDGIVDAADYTIWANHFEPAPPNLAQAVPEPSTAVLALLAFALLAVAGWRQRLGAMRSRAGG